MSERYARLFALPENLYASGAPVVIAAGALLKDNETGRVLAQLKLRSISSRQIKGGAVTVAPLDTVGKPLGEAVEHQYLDLRAARNTEFGQKVPVPLPDPATRGFSAAVSEVYFADNTTWTAGDAPWEPLTPPEPLERALGDRELAEQYRRRYGHDCRFLYREEKDLWRCPCGALNRREEEQCHLCRRKAAELAALDLEKLKADRDLRLAEERKKAEEARAAAEERAKAAAEKRAAMMVKVKKIARIAVPAVIVLIVAGVLISGRMKKAAAYNDAAALLEAGEYDDAEAAFAALENYKDSADMVLRTRYEKAQALIAYAETGSDEGLSLLPSEDGTSGGNGNFTERYYAEATAIFTELGDYQDSAQQIERIRELRYQAAEDLLEAGKYSAAYDAFSALEGYRDSGEIAQQMLEENNALQEAWEAYWEGDLAPIQAAIANNQYVQPSESDKKNIAFVAPYIGKWTYLSGDAQTLSMRGKDSAKYTDCLSVETKFGFDTRNNPILEVHYNNTWDGYDVNYAGKTIEPVTTWIGGDFYVALTPQDTLLVTLERYDGAVVTCQYSRAAE